jgi:hypothetical protein
LGAAENFFAADFRALVSFLKLWRAIGALEGVQIFLRSLVLSLFLAVALCGQPALENARRGQLTLGPDVWSQIIRVENTAQGGRYPQTVYALVFELQGVLWFYTDSNGTQSFSLHHDNLAAEKADFGPLLRDIEPGFARWRGLSGAEVGRIKPSAELRNGCFIESVALWRERVAQGEATEEPRLLSLYFDPRARRGGHTVLAFREGGTVKLIDPARPWAVVSAPLQDDADPLALARQIGGNVVTKARFLSLATPPAHAEPPSMS